MFLGIIIGAVLGVIVMSFVNAAGRADECAACLEKRFPEPFNVEVEHD